MANPVSLASQQLVYLIPDGRETNASSTGTAGASSAGQRHQASPVLRAGGEVQADQAPALCSCQTVQARQQGFAKNQMRTLLGRVIRDVQPKIADSPSLGDAFALPLSPARQLRDQRQRQRGKKLYSLHAPEIECIGKGKAHKPYELMAWTTPASRRMIATRAGHRDDIPCQRRRLPPSASTWGNNSFHVIGFDRRGALVLRQKRSRHQLESSLANILCLPDRHEGLRRGPSAWS